MEMNIWKRDEMCFMQSSLAARIDKWPEVGVSGMLLTLRPDSSAVNESVRKAALISHFYTKAITTNLVKCPIGTKGLD